LTELGGKGLFNGGGKTWGNDHFDAVAVDGTLWQRPGAERTETSRRREGKATFHGARRDELAVVGRTARISARRTHGSSEKKKAGSAGSDCMDGRRGGTNVVPTRGGASRKRPGRMFNFRPGKRGVTGNAHGPSRNMSGLHA